MKTALATVMIVAFGVTGVSLWHEAHTRSIDVSSSQIYIHGTPVCVMRHGGEILASVGTCDGYEVQPREGGNGARKGSPGETPYYREAPPGLPPGHPPVDVSPVFEQSRKIPI